MFTISCKMNIFNNIKPLSRLSLSYVSRVLPKTRFESYSTTSKKCYRCQSLLWKRAPVLLWTHQRRTVCPFRGFSDTSDLNHLSKTDPTSDSSDSYTRDQGSPQDFSLDVLVALLKQENALDLCVVKVPKQINYAQYLIVVSGYSTRHLKAMALYAIKVYKYMKKNHQTHVKIEGKDTEDWMCIDFGNMVVHFMLPESREVYELEKLWTLRSYDEQLRNMPMERLPEDFIYDLEVTK
ncbi:mitochondrial assembly of ribosomal large subunit protein 1 [Boleophthalmus pectinirostris]|uniref:mitochondrial assembly of ribosomal large subunit protein 1 n=1 Tax=Boleophthalmus pectinirostris TaxID=150288 RepID=UPI000A1C229C|nr:mitochondrial assembly of ribosomal large subunit protein 1 [Boleophthalmus pectinirostris]